MRLFTLVFVLLSLGCHSPNYDVWQQVQRSLQRSEQLMQHGEQVAMDLKACYFACHLHIAQLKKAAQALPNVVDSLQRLCGEYSRQLDTTPLSVGEFFAQDERLLKLRQLTQSTRSQLIDTIRAIKKRSDDGKIVGIKIRPGMIDTLADNMLLGRDYLPVDSLLHAFDLSAASRPVAQMMLQKIATDAQLAAGNVRRFIFDHLGNLSLYFCSWEFLAQTAQKQFFLGEKPPAMELSLSLNPPYMVPQTASGVFLDGKSMQNSRRQDYSAKICPKQSGWQNYRLSARVLLPNAKDSSTIEREFRFYVYPR